MAKLLKLRRGTTSQHSSFTGAEGECTVDTDKDTLVVHDNSTAGGRALLREDLNNIGTGVITAAMMGANSVDSSELVDGGVDTSHLSADCVTGAKIADDAIDSEHYTDGSIDNAHIADDAIDSEHYAAGSIDTAHIADDQITLAKMASGTDGVIITYDASGNPVHVGPGTDGQVLTSTGAGSPPAFEDSGAGTPTDITVADESSDTTCFPLFVTAAAGDLAPKTGSNLAFNSSSGALTATSFSGDGSSLTGVAATSADGCVYENAQTISNNYTMTSNKSGMSAGPITVSATVTIPSGSSWSIV